MTTQQEPTTAPAIYRYEVDVDDAWHTVELKGAIVGVAARRHDRVEFWAIHDPSAPVELVRLKVFGTGHPIDVPDGCQIGHVGTALVQVDSMFAGFLSGLVWHLFMAIPPFHAGPDGPKVRRLW